MTTPLAEPQLEADDIQGNNLRGFDTDFLQLVSLKLGAVVTARTWLARLASRIASVSNVHAYRLRRTAGEDVSNEVLVNVALSRVALDAFAFDSTAIGDGFFNYPMGKLGGSLGDRIENGLPVDYDFGHDWARTPDVLLLLGAANEAALDATRVACVADAMAAGLTVLRIDRGNKLAGEREHFGFRDGISQVGPRGYLPDGSFLTPRVVDTGDPAASTFARPGQPLVWPGQFVFGYPTQGLDPLVAQAASGAAWMRNGALLVFRKLAQDVAGFKSYLKSAAAPAGTTPDVLGAMIVGRWPDGTPIQLSPTAPDPTLAADILRVNHFSPSGVADMRVAHQTIPGSPPDNEGVRCPMFAHIRKVNPRGERTDQGEAARTLTFQMLRRGIPYGTPYTPTASGERGLLFLAYQTSFAGQFRLLNSQWMNNPDVPEQGDEGVDLLVGQSVGARSATLVDHTGNPRGTLSTEARFVIAKGGAFLFSPSVTFLRTLGPANS